jgi:NTP pyrophosphatase (non-canonical NTP hydrolase)
MNISNYQDLAARTINRELTTQELTRHALYGLCAEVGEIHSLYQKRFQGHDFKASDLRKEIGDVCWMIAELCTAHGWSMDEICAENIEKLKMRYPSGFSAERSLHREQ